MSCNVLQYDSPGLTSQHWLLQATVSEMAKQAIGVDDELFLDSALMDSGMAASHD